VKKQRTYPSTIGPLMQEARLESLDSGHVSADLARRIGDLQKEHAKVVLDQIQSLRAALGDARFEVLDKFVRQGH